jgi:hypothetical protein
MSLTGLTKAKREQEKYQKKTSIHQTEFIDRKIDELTIIDPLYRVQTDNATPLISSLFTSFFAVTLLYQYIDQKDLWIAVFLMALIIVSILESNIPKYFYDIQESNDLDNITVIRVLRFIYTTLILMSTKVVFDVATFFALTSILYFYNYIDIMALVVTTLFILFTKI